jgi:TP901 family phage tail tape measure protein
MVEAATEFRKNGFNDSDAATLAKTATMFQNVSDEAISAGDSASFIISQMIAFGIEAENAQSIIDKVNETANKFSVSSGDLSKALGIVASTSSAMGNSIDQTLGVVTAITEQTRNASKSARAANTIFSRLAQVVDENSDTGKKLTEIYNNLGIALYDSSGQMRSTYDILADLASKWDSLDKNTQQYIAITSAGTNQLNNFLALMNNFDHAAEATATSINSAGSAMRENEAYQESLEYQTNNLKATFQDLANNVIDKQLISALLTLGDAFLKVANTGLGTFITKVGLLAGTGWGLSSLLKVTKIVPVITSQFSNLATVIGMIGNPAVVSSIGGIGTALSAVGGVAGIALPALLGISAAIVGIITLANALEENAHKAEKQLQDLRTQIDEMEDPASEYSNLKSRVDELIESEKIRLGVLQSQLDTFKEQEEVISRQQLAKWQKGQVEDQTTYVTNYDDYGYGVTEAYTYNQAADSLNNFREAYLDLERAKKSGNMSDETYISNLQSLIDKNQTTITNLRDLKTAYEETGDATYKLNEDQERFLLWADAASEKLATNATNVANAVQAEQDAADGLEDAMSQIEVATYDTSTAAAQLTASLFDQNGQLTTAGLQALSVDSSMRSLATSELQAQQAAAQANYANLILEIQKVGSAAMITAGQLSQMMALAGVGSAQGLVGGLASGANTDIEGLKSAFFRSFGKSADANVADFNKWVSSRVSAAGQSTYDKIMEETQKRLDELEKNFPSGGGGGGGSSRKSAEEKAAEEAEKQAKKAQKAQEKAAKQSQQAYESAASSAEQAAQEAARAAEQAAEEAKQKILDSIQELKDASDDFWDSKTDAIEETNKELDRQKQLEEKLKALEEAKQKKILLYKNGQFQYDKDYGTIAKAQADYEETRDKIQRERELEQLEEMKDNATEIFNEMKDIVQNGGDVTQEMINNWLKNMVASGADYYDSNKKLLGEWLDWAKNALQTYGQGVVDAVNGYISTSSLMSNGTYGSNAQGMVATDTNGARYLADRNSDNPLYWDKDGNFVGFTKAFWIDVFDTQIKKGQFGDYKTTDAWLGNLPGTSIFDDWEEVFKYWSSQEHADIYALQDMVDRFDAAKQVFQYYKDIFKSLGYDEYAKMAEQYDNIDSSKYSRMAWQMSMVQHPDDPFGWRSYEPAWRGTRREDTAELWQTMNDILDMMWANNYQGNAYETALGEAERASKRDWHINRMDESDRYEYATFDLDKLKAALEENEEAIKQLSEKWFEAATDLERQAIAVEAESRRRFRDLGYAQLGIDTTSQSEAERAANRQPSGKTLDEARRDKKLANNVDDINKTLEKVENGQAISQGYITKASDYISKMIDENSEKWFTLYDQTEKDKLHQQTEELRALQEKLQKANDLAEINNLLVHGEALLPNEKADFEDEDWKDDKKYDDWVREAEDLDDTAEDIRRQMELNAQRWFDADEKTKDELHRANEELAERLAQETGTNLSYSGATGKWSKNATGTRNFRGGLSLVGERGPEMRILGQGDNVIPANQTANLWKWSNTTPQQMLTTLSARSGGNNTSYAFDVSRIELPNVTDAKSFVQGLKNYALQYSYKR